MLKAIAIDDEPKALEIIQSHADKIPFLSLTKTFRDPMSAIEWIQINPCDILLLDINMPHLSGLKFRKIIGQKTMIIFTTAYSEYAVESYEQNAVDYLLKPIQFHRFFQAIVKAKELFELKNSADGKPIPGKNEITENSIYIKSGNKKYKINTSDILYLQKDGNYVFFHLKDKKIMSRMNMQQALDILPEKQFIRIHKSWIISTLHIEVLKTNQVVINSTSIPIGKSFEQEIKKMGQ